MSVGLNWIFLMLVLLLFWMLEGTCDRLNRFAWDYEIQLQKFKAVNMVRTGLFGLNYDA